MTTMATPELVTEPFAVHVADVRQCFHDRAVG